AAYEAAYLAVPTIVSDWPVLRDNFAKGALLVDNTAEGLAECLGHARDRIGELRQGARELRADKLARWRDTRRQVERLLSQPRASAEPPFVEPPTAGTAR